MNTPMYYLTQISSREREVLNLIADGYTAKEIADNLYISTHTVQTHRKNLIMKYGAKNTVHMVAKALFNLKAFTQKDKEE